MHIYGGNELSEDKTKQEPIDKMLIVGIIFGILACVFLIWLLFDSNERFAEIIDENRDIDVTICEHWLEDNERNPHGIRRMISQQPIIMSPEEQQERYDGCVKWFENGMHEKWVEAGENVSTANIFIIIMIPIMAIVMVVVILSPITEPERDVKK